MNSAKSPETPARLLVVDDDENVRSTYRQLLTRAGYRVQKAASGKEGLFCLEQQPYDLILLDLNMPGMNGLEFLGRMHRIRYQKHAPEVLVISGYATIDRVVEVTKLGAQGVVEKPISSEKLLSRIEHLLNLRKDPVILYIRTHLKEINSREDIARHLHICGRTVSNRIKSYNGQGSSLN